METGGRMTRSRAKAIEGATPAAAAKAAAAAKSTARATGARGKGARDTGETTKELFADGPVTISKGKKTAIKAAAPALDAEPSLDIMPERSLDQCDSAAPAPAPEAEASSPVPAPQAEASEEDEAPVEALTHQASPQPMSHAMSAMSPLVGGASNPAAGVDADDQEMADCIPSPAPMAYTPATAAAEEAPRGQTPAAAGEPSPLNFAPQPPPLAHLTGIGYSPAPGTPTPAPTPMSVIPIAAANPALLQGTPGVQVLYDQSGTPVAVAVPSAALAMATPQASPAPAPAAGSTTPVHHVTTGQPGSTPLVYIVPPSAQPSPMLCVLPGQQGTGLTAFAGHTPPALHAFAGHTPGTLEPNAARHHLEAPAPSPALSFAPLPSQGTPLSSVTFSLAPTPMSVASMAAMPYSPAPGSVFGGAASAAPSPMMMSPAPAAASDVNGGFAFFAPAAVAPSPTLAPFGSAAAGQSTPTAAGPTPVPVTADDLAALEDEGLMELNLEASIAPEAHEEEVVMVSAAPEPEAAQAPAPSAATPKPAAAGATPKAARSTTTPGPVAAKTPKAAAGNTSTFKPAAATPKAPTPSASKPLSRPTTPLAGAAKTPAPAANAVTPAAAVATLPKTAGAKSTKRVSMAVAAAATPKGAAPRPSIVRTPYPKSAGPEKTPEQDEEVEEESVMQAAPAAAAPAPEAAAPAPAADAQKPAPAPAVDPAQVQARKEKAAQHLARIAASDAGLSRPAPSYMSGTAASQHRAKLASKVEVEPGYDPRSLGQLRRDIKVAAERKSAKERAAVVVHGPGEVRTSKAITPRERDVSEEPEDTDMLSDDEAQYDQATEAGLVAALDKLELAKSAKKGKAVAPLRGLPVPTGSHLSFDDAGNACREPARVPLRGVPASTGSYKRWS